MNRPALIPTVSDKSIAGRIKYRLQNGTRSFFRRRIRKRILALLPRYEYVTDQNDATLHMLVCRRDHEMAIITASLFNRQVGRGHRFVFHDDGTITEDIAKKFSHYLPGTTMVRREKADSVAAEQLNAYPRIQEFRRSQIMALKLIDAKLWGQGERIGYVDSDILFLKYPKEFLNTLKSARDVNYFNRDIADAYVLERTTIERALGYGPAARVNAGLWVMNAADIDLDKIENWLVQPLFSAFRADYRLDQTFISMLAQLSESGVGYFPEGYDVDMSKDVSTSICKHYVGRIRYGYELEGLRYLLDSGAFGPNLQTTSADR